MLPRRRIAVRGRQRPLKTGALVLDERLGANSFAGLGLIILGVWVASGGGRCLADRLRREREAVEVEAMRGGGTDGPGEGE